MSHTSAHTRAGPGEVPRSSVPDRGADRADGADGVTGDDTGQDGIHQDGSQRDGSQRDGGRREDTRQDGRRQAGAPGIRPPLGTWPKREQGSGTVLVLGLVGVAVVLVVTALGVGAALAARHRAAAAADLAALAAIDSGKRCSGAAQVAAINGARLASCEFSADGSVAVSVLVELPGLAADALGEARAGPGPAQIPSLRSPSEKKTEGGTGASG